MRRNKLYNLLSFNSPVQENESLIHSNKWECDKKIFKNKSERSIASASTSRKLMSESTYYKTNSMIGRSLQSQTSRSFSVLPGTSYHKSEGRKSMNDIKSALVGECLFETDKLRQNMSKL
jgi:hypothetical protein